MTKKRPDSHVTCQKTPSGRGGWRPKGSGEGLTVTVTTKLRPEEVGALEAAMRDTGAKTRAEIVRLCIRSALGV